MRIFRTSRPRPMTEALAYARCHGDRSHEIVRVFKAEPRRPRYDAGVSGEAVRVAFEAKLLERSTLHQS